MEQSKIHSILTNLKGKIPDDKMPYLKSLLDKADDSRYELICMAPEKNPTTTLLLSIFVGGLGVDRFFIGDTGLGVAKLLLGWLTFGIWSFVDIFCCYKKTKEKNFQNIIMNL